MSRYTCIAPYSFVVATKIQFHADHDFVASWRSTALCMLRKGCAARTVSSHRTKRPGAHDACSALSKVRGSPQFPRTFAAEPRGHPKSAPRYLLRAKCTANELNLRISAAEAGRQKRILSDASCPLPPPLSLRRPRPFHDEWDIWSRK